MFWNRTDLRERALAVCRPLVTQVTALSEPLNTFGEDLDREAAADLSLLGEIPTWIEGLTPGSEDAVVMATFHWRALFHTLGPWLSALVPHVANLRWAPFLRNEDVAPHVERWATVCPAALLQWWVVDPGVVFDTEKLEEEWGHLAKARTRFLHEEMKNDHPWLTPDRLWHNPHWRRVLLDGIRPGSSKWGSDEAELLAQILNEGLQRWSPTERQSVEADPCFPRWEVAWNKAAATQAVWRAHQTPEVTLNRTRLRHRS